MKTRPIRRAASLLGLVSLLSLMPGCSGPRLLTTFAAPIGADITVTRDLAYGPAPKQTLDIYRPEGQGPFPVLVFVHGGAWNSGSRQGYAFAGERYAAEGYLTAVIGYRLVPEVTYPAFVEDTALAISYVHANAAAYGGTRETLFAVGHSAGAYNVVQAALAPEVWPAGKSPAILDAVIGLAGPYDFLPLGRDSARAAFGGTPDLGTTQPVNRVTKDAPPMLLVYGQRDKSVGPTNIASMEAALKAAKVPVETIIYPDTNHADLVIGMAFPGRNSVVADTVQFMQKAATTDVQD
ncbi:alpha/beta hydrolase [Parvularcula sp. LCG005]|uniref:alpha/beta hydrolase n=1 Tax=Parvularcula sp. LCG005 TaxID=3078805 RepID=UPI00294339B5|nr:alpha/beta hydrolase [Parvularcula sp. LCG005]WOI53721.1 alpha/beta hydrolase [Parvularcula sp. LCG005]